MFQTLQLIHCLFHLHTHSGLVQLTLWHPGHGLMQRPNIAYSVGIQHLPGVNKRRNGLSYQASQCLVYTVIYSTACPSFHPSLKG